MKTVGSIGIRKDWSKCPRFCCARLSDERVFLGYELVLPTVPRHITHRRPWRIGFQQLADIIPPLPSLL